MEIASPGDINLSKDSGTTHYNFIVIGGGIAGVTCAETVIIYLTRRFLIFKYCTTLSSQKRTTRR